MAYDSARGVTVLFGGIRREGGTWVACGDTWEWNGATWSQRAITGPSPRSYVTMVYDTARGVTVLFGGVVYDGTYVSFDDTWEWDGNVWHREDVLGPSARFAYSMTYDSARAVTVLFGGLYIDGAYHWYDDTWEFDGAEWTQRPVSGPSARSLAAMTYDVRLGTTLLFGGGGGQGLLADTWKWDGQTWAELDVGGPSGRDAPLVYDRARNHVLLFGGYRGTNGYCNDTWQFDGEAWRQLNPSGAPSPRGLHAMAYDSLRRVTVLFGGELSGTEASGETWEFVDAVGDLNCDGAVNFGDIDPFVLALSDPAGYQAAYPNCNILNGDCNRDGQVNFEDIDPFVALLISG